MNKWLKVVDLGGLTADWAFKNINNIMKTEIAILLYVKNINEPKMISEQTKGFFLHFLGDPGENQQRWLSIIVTHKDMAFNINNKKSKQTEEEFMNEKFKKIETFFSNIRGIIKANSSIQVRQIYFFDLLEIFEKTGNYKNEIDIFKRFFSDLDLSKKNFISSVKTPIFLSNLILFMLNIHHEFSKSKQLVNENEMNNIEKTKSQYIKKCITKIDEKLSNLKKEGGKDQHRLEAKIKKVFLENIERSKCQANLSDNEFVEFVLKKSEPEINEILFSIFTKKIMKIFNQFKEEVKNMINENKFDLMLPLNNNLIMNSQSFSFSKLAIYMSISSFTTLNTWKEFDFGRNINLESLLFQNVAAFLIVPFVLQKIGFLFPGDVLGNLMSAFKEFLKESSDKIASTLNKGTENLFNQCVDQIKKSKEMSESFLNLMNEIKSDLEILSKKNQKNFKDLEDLIKFPEIFPDDKWIQCYLNFKKY